MNYPKNADRFMFLLMMFLIFIGNFVLLGILKLFPNLLSTQNIWIIQSIFSVICFISPIILVLLIKKIKFKYIIPLKPLSLKNFFLIIFLSFTIQPMLQLIGAITNVFYKDEISDAIAVFASLSLPKALFVSALVPAITEELVFRGVILTGYKKTTVLIGILMSSFYFGVMHFTISQLFYAIVGGIIFGYLVKVTKSIWSSILMHFIFNGSQITIAHIAYKYTPNVNEQILNATYTFKDLIYPLIYFLFTLPLLLLSIFLFIICNKREIRELKEENNQIKNNIDSPKVFTLFFYINIIVYVVYMILKK